MRATITQILTKTGWSQTDLADQLDVKQATVSRWIAGSDPRGQTRERINALLERIERPTGSVDLDAVARKLVAAPLISWVGASELTTPDAPLPDDDHETVYAMGLDPRGDWIALRVVGTSMDRISPPDSVIFVNRKDKMLVANACYVIASEDSGEASYKRFRPGPDRWEPVSTADHETLYASAEMTPKIIGRVRLSTIMM